MADERAKKVKDNRLGVFQHAGDRRRVDQQHPGRIELGPVATRLRPI